MPQIILGAIFAAMSLADGIAHWVHNNKAEENARKEKERQRDAQLKMMDLTYEQEKKKANKAADQSDKEADFGEIMLGNQYNGALDQLGLGQEAKTLEYNQAAITSGSNTGAGYQQLATSGTKNSSAQQAIDMQENLNEQHLQAQENIDRKADVLTLESALNTMQQGTFNLQNKRTAANDLREAYKEGGDAYTMYQQNRANVQSGYNYQIGQMKSDFAFNQYTNTMNLTSNALNAFDSGFKVYDRYKTSADLWK